MSEYLVQRQSLENIADEIRVLSGTTEPLGLTEMATNVNDANDEVADQTDLIAQLASALQGKSVPGGGEDVTAEVTAQITLIDDLEAAVDALPDAGSGGVETCTVKLGDLSYASMRPYCYSYTHLDDNGNVTSTAVKNNSTSMVTLNNVICGSVVTVYWYQYFPTNNLGLTNATLLTSYDNYFNAFRITASAGGTASIYGDMSSVGGSND